jgi:hypothetical protein
MKRYTAAMLFALSCTLGAAVALADDPGPDTLEVRTPGATVIYQGLLLGEEATAATGYAQFSATTVQSFPASRPGVCAAWCYGTGYVAEVTPVDGDAIQHAGCAFVSRAYLAESGTFLVIRCP